MGEELPVCGKFMLNRRVWLAHLPDTITSVENHERTILATGVFPITFQPVPLCTEYIQYLYSLSLCTPVCGQNNSSRIVREKLFFSLS